MKKLIALSLILVLSLGLVGCGGTGSSTATPPAGDSGAAAPADNANPGTAPADDEPDWNNMGDDELYELAKAEGGVINIYSSSSRMGKALVGFMETYPGLEAVAHDLGNTEIPKKVQIEAETGNPTADVIMCSDNAGEIHYDFRALGYIQEYWPADIMPHINAQVAERGIPLYAGLSYWFYNTAAFPEGSPVTNWWDIIEQDENGNMKYDLICKEIGSEISYLTLLCNMTTTPDEMAAAYKEKYGTDLEYTYDASQTPGVPENNAGFEFIYRFARSKMTFIDDGDEIVEAVQNSTADKPRLGLSSAGKVTNRDEMGWDIAWVTDLAPYTNMQNISYLHVITTTDNPAGSRLLVRYLAGGADGSAGGLKAMLKEGNWSMRDDYTFDGNPFSIAESGAVVPNIKGIYDVYYDVQDFWIYWQNHAS